MVGCILKLNRLQLCLCRFCKCECFCCLPTISNNTIAIFYVKTPAPVAIAKVFWCDRTVTNTHQFATLNVPENHTLLLPNVKQLILLLNWRAFLNSNNIPKCMFGSDHPNTETIK